MADIAKKQNNAKKFTSFNLTEYLVGLKISYDKKSDIDKGMTEEVNKRKKGCAKWNLQKANLRL